MTTRTCENNLKVHFFYVSCILISAIILLITAKWTELPKFTDYLSTAATVTSLVLGLLAIIYAYISNNSLSETTGVVSEAANATQNATVQISTIVSSLDNVAKSTEQSNARLDHILIELQSEIDSLNHSVNALDQHSQTVATILPDIPKELSRLTKSVEDFAQAAPNQVEKTPETIQDNADLEKLAKTAVKNASPSGMLVMYACHLSKQYSKPVNIKTFAGKFTAGDYMHGYYIALCSINLIKRKKLDKPETIIVTDCPQIFQTCREAFLEKANNLKTDSSKAEWISQLQEIENAFSQAS